jgi:hypothetical protein
LAVRDGVENRRIRVFGGDMLPFSANSAWIDEGTPLVSATSTKISGSSGMAGWKKAKQRRSAGSGAASQIIPAVDGVHRLIFDDLFKDIAPGFPN